MDDRKYPIQDHLEELRKRILYCLFWWAIFASLSWYWTPEIIRLIAVPAGKLVFIGVTEAFFSYLKIALWTGFFCSLPVVFYNLGRYLESALLPQERKYIVIFAPFAIILFIFGAAFAFFLAVPMAVKFLVGFGSGTAEPMLSIGEYVSFFGSFSLAFGAAFEFPLVLLFLIKIGIITPAIMSTYHRHGLLAIFIASAILTPTPDAFTMLLLAVPLVILFEATLFLARFINPIALARRLR